MPHARRRTLIGRSSLALGAALLLFAAASAAVPGAAPAASADAGSSGFTVTATPTSGVIDGQAIKIRVDAPAGKKFGFGSRARICADGPTYALPTDLLPFGAGHCPNAGLSSSATPGGAASLDPLPNQSAVIGTLRVGTGRVEWGPATDPSQFSLTCDAANPCRLVLELQTTSGVVIDASQQITFADAEATASCGGAADGVLTSAGSDRFIDTWARWTRAQCEATGKKASTNAVFTGEGLGLDTFAAGQADLAYSATGPLMPGRAIESPRPSVSVPVALNAVVIGMLGGYPSTDPAWPSGVPHPFTEAKLTPAELATLFGQGFFGFSPQPGDPVLARNPQLATGVTGLGGPAMAPSGSDATSYFATRWFTNRAADAWKTPVVPLDDIPGLTPRGTTSELAAADPAFPVAISSLYSARSSLKQKFAAASLTSAGTYPITWVLTDLATAEQLDIPVASLQNSRGEFVAPTAASLAAAVPTMTVAADGTVMPGTGDDAAGAYPLTFVEQVVAPTQPLLADDCTPRTDSQALLASWVRYLTGDGQQQLDGLTPLTPSLAEVATASAAKIGTAAVTGPCQPAPTTTTTTTTVPPATPSDAGGGLPVGGDFGSTDLPAGTDLGSSALGGSGALASDGSTPAGGAAPVRRSDARSASDAAEASGPSGPKLPTLLGAQPLHASAGLAALLGLAFLGAGAGTLGAGRRPSSREEEA